jgi:PAS domain S-box-containing protein
MTQSIVTAVNRRFLLKTALPFCLALVLGSLVAISVQIEIAKSAQIRHARSLADYVAAYVDRVFDGMERFGGLADKNNEKLLREQLYNLLRYAPEAQRVLWLDAARNVRAAAPEESLHSSFSLAFERGAGARRILSRPAPSLVSGRLAVFIAVSLPGDETLVVELDLETLTSSISSLDPDFKGRAVISDGFGNLISHPDPALVQTQANIASSPLFRAAASGDTAKLYFYDGLLRLGASSQIKGLGWRAFIVEDALAFLAPGLIALGVALFCCLAFVAFTAKRLHRELRVQLGAPLQALVDRVEQYAETPSKTASSENSELDAVLASIDSLLVRLRAKERASREQQGALRTAFERAGVPLAQYDAQGRLLWTNPPFAALAGRACEQMEGALLAEITHPDDALVEAEQIRNALASPGKSYALDKRLLDGKGGEIWVKMRAVWIESIPPESGFFGALALDIDALKRCETDFDQELKRGRLLRDSLADAFVELDEQGRAIDVNSEAERLLHADKNALLGRNVKDVFSLAMSPLFGESVRQAQSTMKPTLVEGRQANGACLECRVFPHPKGAVMLLRDVTERTHAAQALQDSEIQHREIFEWAPAGIFLCGGDGAFILVNPAFEGMVGFSKAELRDKRVKQVIHPDDLPSELALTQELLAGRRAVFELEKRLLRSDGGLIWVRARTKLAQGDQISSPRLVCVLEDITERKRLYDQLKAAKESAEFANHSKNDFLANMSQELRTPLNGVFGMLQLLKHSPLPEQDGQYVELALRSARNLLKCISDIYDVTQVEAERVTLDLRRFALRPLLESIMAHYRSAAEEKDLLYDFKMSEEAPEELFGDEERLRQILSNLLDNAIKYTERGFVFLDVSLSGSSQTARGVLFSVTDSGVGIAGERLSDVFAPFARLDRLLNKKRQGVGLGLTLVKRLTALMGGNVCVDSELGQGATVHCLFPSTLAIWPGESGSIPLSPPVPAPSPVQAPLRKLRLLVAEDDQINSLAAKHMLEHLGHEVVCAANGLEALRALEAGGIDVAFMDVQMPELDGLSATKRIRADRSGRWDPGMPVVALTAFALGRDAANFLAGGMNLVVAKPVTEEALSNALEEVSRLIAKR